MSDSWASPPSWKQTTSTTATYSTPRSIFKAKYGNATFFSDSLVGISDGFSDYVNSSGEVFILLQGAFAVGGGPNARADMITDYIALRVGELFRLFEITD